MLKKILIALLVILVLIQFIRPARNSNSVVTERHLKTLYPVPAEVDQILKKGCYDCHSDYTSYPWYSNVQPLGFWLQHHINEGKEHLNFSEFGKLAKKEQAHAFEEIAEEVGENHMPLESYLWIHKEAELTAQEKQTLITWATTLHEQAKQQQ
jgi:hypothetical protein